MLICTVILVRGLQSRIDDRYPSMAALLEDLRADPARSRRNLLFIGAFALMARTLGMPSRVVVGFLPGGYTGDTVDGQRVAEVTTGQLHAWPEVYLDGWVAVDPTFGQFPADAAHLRFIIGGLARQVELIQLIGRLQLDVIETETDE